MMATTIHSRRRSDAERARNFRASKKTKIDRGIGVPDSRNVAEAFLETNVRILRGAGKVDAAFPLTRVLRSVVGCLIRDGFDRTASRSALKSVLERNLEGPDPILFEALPKEQVWQDFERASAGEIDASVTALERLRDGKA